MKNKCLILCLLGVGIIIIVIGVLLQWNSNDDNDVLDKIVCTQKSESSGVDITKRYILFFTDDKLKKYNRTTTYKYTKESEESALRYKGDWIKSQVQMSTNVNGIDISHNEDKYTITNSFDYDLEVFNPELYSDYIDIYPTYNLDDSVNTIVKEIEGWEFTCR